MSIIEEAQALTNHYGSGIKDVRVIFKAVDDRKLVEIFTPNPMITPLTTGRNLTTYQQDFGAFTERYRGIIQEVRVIFKDGAGASQFFPKGTDERIVWASVIPKEELV
jgi:fibrillarin-like rRNA methylase